MQLHTPVPEQPSMAAIQAFARQTWRWASAAIVQQPRVQRRLVLFWQFATTWR